MKHSTRKLAVISAVVLMGILSLLQYWLAAKRPAALFHADVEFVVTSPLDRGPGSLREAIFAADAAGQRARIVIRSEPIVLENPLPPLLNPAGIIVEGITGLAEINAAQVDRGAILDVASPYSIVRGIKIANAQDQAILARSVGLRMIGLTLSNCDLCIGISSGVSDVVVEESHFEGNRIGISLAAENVGIIIRNNHFRTHVDAAVWAVQGKSVGVPLASTLQISGNHFDGDRLSLVLGNVPALVEENHQIRQQIKK